MARPALSGMPGGADVLNGVPLKAFALLDAQSTQEHQVEAIAKYCGVPPESVENAYPCTPIQEALVSMTDANENSYVMQLVCEMTEQVSSDRFQEAWRATIDANPALRTRICHIAKIGYLQAVIKEDVVFSDATDLSQFLRDDATLPMPSGSPFFRYSIVAQGRSRYFVWTVHHAIADGVSVLEILGEVSRRFCAKPTVPRQPFDQFIKSVISSDGGREKEFWHRYLSAGDATSYPPVPSPDFQANPSSVLQSPIVLDRPPPFGLTKALLLRAAWGVLLSHHAGTEDVVFGTILNGRSSSAVPGISRLAGPTICLLPVTVHVEPKEPVASFLARIRHQAAELKIFEQTGMSKIRKYMAEGSAACDFENLFVVHPADFKETMGPAVEKMGLKVIPHLGKLEQHPYPLVVSATLQQGKDVMFRLEYDERVISTQQARNLINQFQAVLSGLGNATTETLLESISPLSEADVAQIRQWNPSIPPMEETCFHHVFERQALKQPDATALCSLLESLSYAEVDNLSSALAMQLMELGIGPEIFVAICFEKSIWTVVAMLAVFKAGGAYVPIDPGHPRARISEMVDSAQIRVAIVSHASRGVMEGLCEHIVTVHDPAPSLLSSKPCNASQRVQPSNTAYLVFTSGSTGKPKGVLVPHSALCTGMFHHAQAFGLGPESRMLQFAAYTFDTSVQEIFATLASGGCVCVPSDQDRVDDLSGAIVSLGVDTAVLTPTVANLLTPEEVPALKTMILGGEPVTSDIIKKWSKHVDLTNGYGLSETTVCCGANLHISTDTHAANNIGRSLGATMWIVDQDNHHQLSAIGCVGEIVVSGALVAKGYHADKIATDASFVPAPDWLRLFHSESPHKTVFKTGDLARYNADGTIQYVGRKDSQVKLRGFRIELGEIESRIMEHGTATTALALLPLRGPCARQLVAVVSFHRPELSDHGELNITLSRDDQGLRKLKAHLSLTLPEYMVPHAWVLLESMPLLVSGKIDRKAITSWIERMDPDTYKMLMEDRDIVDISNFIPGTLATALRGIWSEVLNVPTDQIGTKTSFFSLGGDSISAIQVVSKAKKLGLQVTVRGILSGKTLGTIGELAEQGYSSEPGILERLQIPRWTKEPFDLSPIQRWFVEFNAENMPAARFHQALVVRLRRVVPLETIENAFSAVVERHEMLRTVFLKEHGWRKQRVVDSLDKGYRFRHHGQVGDSRDETRRIIDEGHSSIDIAGGPTFSVDVFETSNGTHLFVTAHHLVIDLVSWRILLQDVDEYITTGSFGGPTGCSFYQWTQFLEATFGKDTRHLQQSEDGEEGKNGVEQDLQFLENGDLQNTYKDIERTKWSLGRTVTRGLLDLVNREQSPQLVDLMIACVTSSFVQTFGRACPDLFVESHGREPLDSGIDLSSTVGWFTVMYPIVNFPSEGNDNLAHYVEHVQKSREAHPANGLEQFSRLLLSKTDASKLKSRPIQFNYHGSYQQFEGDGALFEWVDYPGLEDTLVGPEVRRLTVFEIEAALRDGQLEFSMSFPRDLKCAALAKQWFQKTKSTLEGLGEQFTNGCSELSSSGFGGMDQLSSEKSLTSLLTEVPGVKIEDAYPCSPLQREILKQQKTDPSVFLTSWEMEFYSEASQTISLDGVVKAWRAVVRKHPVLRTIFIQDLIQKQPPLQVVLSELEPEIIVNSDIAGFQATLETGGLLPLNTPRLLHRIRFYQQGSSVLGYLEANHLILDGWSLGLIKADILAFCHENGPRFNADTVPYKPFINAHREDRVRLDRNHWRSALRGQQSSLLDIKSVSHSPQSDRSTKDSCSVIQLPDLPRRSLLAFCAEREVTTASIFDAAWAQTLSLYTKSADVSFGYIVSGRDQEVPDALNIVGPLINILAFHLRGVPTEESALGLAQVARQVQEQRILDSQHTFCDIQEVLEEDLKVGRLFNTAVNFQRRSSDVVQKQSLKVRDLGRASDPWHFDVLVRIIADDDSIRARVEFNGQVLDRDSMEEVAEAFWRKVHLAVT